MRKAALDEVLRRADRRRRASRTCCYSVHLKATMMKVSDPIIFGHGLEAFVGTELFDEVRRRQPQRRSRQPARRAPRGQGRGRRRAGRRAGSLHGRFGQGRHQPARAQRRDRRRVDAGAGPLVGPGLERRGRAAGHEVRDSRLELCGALPGDDRSLPCPRRLRPGDDGHHAQRRADGPEGRGIRLARQDLRDRGAGRGARGRPERLHAARARRRGRRHLAHVPGQGRPDPRLGRAGRAPRPRHRLAGGVLARRGAPARRGSAGQGAR